MANNETNVPAVPGASSKLRVPERPDFLKAQEPQNIRGLENMEARDMVMPRLAICQSMTPQRMEINRDIFIPELKEGDMFNTLTGQIYGRKVQVVPLFFYKSRIWFKDLKEGGGILCQAPDGKSCQLNHGGPCLHSSWGPNGEPPECTEFFNYPSLLWPSGELVVVSLKVTGLKAAKQWNSMMRMRKADTFAGIYEISTNQDKNKAGQVYYRPDVNNGNPPWVTKEFYANAENMYETVFEGVASGRIRADERGLDTEQGGLNESEAAFASRDAEM